VTDLTAILDNNLLNAVLAQARDGVVVVDAVKPDYPMIFVNKAFEELTGYKSAELLGLNCRMLQGEGSDSTAIGEMAEAVKLGQACSVRIKNYKKNGSEFWSEIDLSPIADDQDRISHYVGIVKDVSERVAVEHELVNTLGELKDLNRVMHIQSIYDDLTGLFNRRHFLQDLDRLWRISQRDGNSFGLLMLDVDRFKQFNECHDDVDGDDCLMKIAGVMQAKLSRAKDMLGRYSGEQFIAAIMGTSFDELRERATVICEGVRQLGIPFEQNTGVGVLSVSIGGALVNSASGSWRSMLKAADNTLLQAKSGGRGQAVCVMLD